MSADWPRCFPGKIRHKDRTAGPVSQREGEIRFLLHGEPFSEPIRNEVRNFLKAIQSIRGKRIRFWLVPGVHNFPCPDFGLTDLVHQGPVADVQCLRGSPPVPPVLLEGSEDHRALHVSDRLLC